MASGSFEYSAVSQYVDGKVEWSSTTNASNNSSDLTLVAYSRKSSSSSSSSTITNKSITRNFYVDGTKYGSTENATISLKNNNSYVKVYEKTIKGIKHNDDGTKSLEIGFEMIYSGSDAFKVPKTTAKITLDKIPRYPSASQSLEDSDEKSITIKWSSDSTIDYVWYSIDGGNNFTAVGGVNAKSGTYTISGLSVKDYPADIKEEVVTRLRRKDSQLTKDTTILEVSRPFPPYAKDKPTFEVGGALKITLYNPKQRNVKIYITPHNGSDILVGTTTSTSLNVAMTDSIKQSLYQASPNSAKNGYDIKVVYDAIHWTMYNINGEYTIPNTPPDFESFNYLDSNSISVGVTGSNQYIVKNKSVLKVVIPSANKMVAKNYASPDRYEISCSNRKTSVSYSEEDINVELGTINSYGLMNIVVTAYDSRGFATKKPIQINVIDYTEVSQENGLYRVNQFERDTKLLIKGTFNPLVIDGIAKNTIQSVKYRYKLNGEEYPENYTIITPTINNNKYEYEMISFDLDNSKSFLFEIIVVDNFGDSKPLEIPLNEGIPIMFISSAKRNLGIGCQNNHEEGSLETASHFYCGGNIFLADGTPILTYRVIDSEGNEVT